MRSNNEFNAVAYSRKHPDRPDEYLRPHSPKNDDQHRAFLEQVDPATRATYLEWFATMPLWLNLGGLRVVHAGLHEPSIQTVVHATGSSRFSTQDHFVRASDKGDPLYDAIEVLLKGPEIDLAQYGLPPYRDKGGYPRRSARVAWWRGDATTVREFALIGRNLETSSGETYPPVTQHPDRAEGPRVRLPR